MVISLKLSLDVAFSSYAGNATTRVEDENAFKASWTVHVSEIPVTVSDQKIR